MPQLLAAAVIGRDPKRYGFDVDAPGDYKYMQLPNRYSLKTLAAGTNSSVAQLRKLNPDLSARAKRTPVNNYILRIPAAWDHTLITARLQLMPLWTADSQEDIAAPLLAKIEAEQPAKPALSGAEKTACQKERRQPQKDRSREKSTPACRSLHQLQGTAW